MTDFFEEYHELLYNCFKPYQYVGGEFLSYNKDFNSAKVRVAFAFPDKYEIGISNLGQRILYGLVNDNKEFMADRVYAPEGDFKESLEKIGKSLYALESKKPLKEFDLIGFSLQYELAYPTTLAMLNMSDIEVRRENRSEDSPIVIAGGPCTYNPLPMVDFIDGFVIGDGEEIMLEICEVIKKSKAENLSRKETIKNLSEVEGLYVPEYPKDVRKRIVQIGYDNALKKYPIPFSSSVHDRATVEIRRGCGRMCRFCQPGHVTLPVRERSAEDIINITKELVKNTGYDEYSLLSLSSNDYKNINEVIKELGEDFNKKKISVSLPSQRIDGFNLELANLVQSVRKSTMTLAPEAGSQRLRDVIRKNITEEQILNAATTLYENGWSKLKFYFIVGLPTETMEDIDETINLFRKIKYRVKQIKAEKQLKHSLDITCTFSIFVPKPFTPFQWFGQTDLKVVTERIHHLKDGIKNIKGLKIHYHEQAVSQIEAVLTRGDESLCKYIEKLYEKGCYLDAWGEYLNEDTWKETAEELGISLEALAQQTFKTDEKLPWDFIKTGLDKEWLINEYKDSLKNQTNPSCQTGCVNCGVCKNFKTVKVMATPYKSTYEGSFVKEPPNPKLQSVEIPTVKYRVKLTKKGILRYFSHLDWQNTFLKALSRTGLKIAYSQGFNPMMKVSMGVALPLFIESESELVDIELLEKVKIEEIKLKLEKVLPEGCEIINVQELPKGSKSIDTTAYWAEYEVRVFDTPLHKNQDLIYNMNKVLSSEEILLTKKNKKGILKTVNIKQSIKSYKIDGDVLSIVLKTGQGCEIPAVRADDLMKVIAPDILFNIKRVRFFDENVNEL